MKLVEISLNCFSVFFLLLFICFGVASYEEASMSRETLDAFDDVLSLMFYPSIVITVLATGFNYSRRRNFLGTITLGILAFYALDLFVG